MVPVFCCLFHSMSKGKKGIYMANDCFEFKWMGMMMIKIMSIITSIITSIIIVIISMILIVTRMVMITIQNKIKG